MVFLMQAGFAMLEVGFSRGKNVGAVVAKILVNLSIGTIVFWAVGFALAFGNGNKVLGTDGFFLHSSTFTSLSFSDVPLSAKFLFEVVFCTVSLAIVWGTMLDRTKFGVYIVFAIVFAALIYPLVGHWIWGGGFLAQRGMQDFAGSTVVHLCGATAALAGTLMLGARIGKFDSKGKAHPIPGHSMPLAVLGVLILWFGWFGFNPGSTLGAVGARFADIAVTTNLAAAAGVLGAIIAGFVAPAHDRHRLRRQRRDRRPGRHHGALRLRRGLGRVRDRPGRRRPHGLTVVAVDRIRVDDPIGAIAGHGMGGIWGTLSCGLFTTPRWPRRTASARPACSTAAACTSSASRRSASLVVAAFVFCVQRGRVLRSARRRSACASSAQQELEGLDIHEHGMWGYPEQFLPGYGASQPYVLAPNRRPPAPRLARSRRSSAATTEGGD